MRRRRRERRQIALVLQFNARQASRERGVHQPGNLARGLRKTEARRADVRHAVAFGVVAAAARLEGSKAFMKDLFKKYGVPTAWYGRFDDATKAKALSESRMGALTGGMKIPGLM